MFAKAVNGNRRSLTMQGIEKASTNSKAFKRQKKILWHKRSLRKLLS